MININREELAWAAGLVDGEGTISCKKGGYKGYPFFVVQQTENMPVLLRLKAAIGGMGTMYGPYGPYKGNIGKRPHHRLEVYGFEKTQAVVALLWKWLSPIKRAQAVSVLVEKESKPYGRSTS